MEATETSPFFALPSVLLRTDAKGKNRFPERHMQSRTHA